MKTIISTNQKTLDLLNSNNVKDIKWEINNSFDNGELGIGHTLLELIKQNSNDFTKDISTKCLENEYSPSEKQSWCCAYQIKNNIEVYKLSMLNYDKTLKI